MLAARGLKPKLSLSVSTAAAQSSKPSLSLKSPVTALRPPLSPLPPSPTSRNTKLNQRGFSTAQHPNYQYANNSTSKSILKKGQQPTSLAQRRLQFSENPVVYCVSPIEDEEYYGTYRKMTKDERRWQARP